MKKNLTILKTLDEARQQVYVGRQLHTLGLIRWITEQTGKADVIVTTFSTSVEFLSGFFNLKKENLIGNAVVVLDLKAAKKTARLNTLLTSCFDEVYLAENHTKIVLVYNADHHVCVITSMNNTYGGRNECTFISTDEDLFFSLHMEVQKIIHNSYRYDRPKPISTDSANG